MKIIITIIIFCALGITGVVYAQDSENGLVSNGISSIGSKVNVDVENFIKKIDKISNVKINDEIFKDASFQSLRDWSRPLPDEAVGRDNPFAPI